MPGRAFDDFLYAFCRYALEKLFGLIEKAQMREPHLPIVEDSNFLATARYEAKELLIGCAVGLVWVAELVHRRREFPIGDIVSQADGRHDQSVGQTECECVGLVGFDQRLRQPIGSIVVDQQAEDMTERLRTLPPFGRDDQIGVAIGP